MKKTFFLLLAFVALTSVGFISQKSYARVSTNQHYAYNEFIFPDSSIRFLHYNDLDGLTLWELKIARNEIYARNGRKFTNNDLKNYFNNTSWYVGSIPANKFNENSLNKYERANINLIQDFENSLTRYYRGN